MVLRARESDIALIESLIPEIQAEYKNRTNKDVHLKMDQDNFLSAESCGGIELLAARGKLY